MKRSKRWGNLLLIALFILSAMVFVAVGVTVGWHAAFLVAVALSGAGIMAAMTLIERTLP